MNNQEKPQLRDANIAQTNELLAEILGESYAAYESFQNALKAIELEQEWQWFSQHKVWAGRGWHRWVTPRGAQKEKTLYWLYVYDGYFSVTVWFLDKNRLELLKADVSEQTKKMIKESSNFADKFKTFPVTIDILDTASLAEVYTLIDWKKKLEK
jgi:hypothetical protein